MEMRMKIYNFLVNRHDGIRRRYHAYRDRGGMRAASYLYLLGLNAACCFGAGKCLDEAAEKQIYEEGNLPTDVSESAKAFGEHPDVEGYVEVLSGYEIISFDIFDTLIFRPFSDPTDLFRFLGGELGILDFGRIRVEQEAFARRDSFAQRGQGEVTLAQIWERIEREVGVSAVLGMELEKKLEERFCYANPFMKQVFRKLRDMGKEIIAVSDMYLPSEFLRELLKKNGYNGISQVYVSCEYGIGKGEGGLFEIVKRDASEEKAWKEIREKGREKSRRIIHLGDNEASDGKMPKKYGLESITYPNVHYAASRFRPKDMSPIIGSAYRGIVGAHLYQGTEIYTMEYEYGFTYGGLFVLGYCHFIHEYCAAHQVDRVLFLSRDGDILKQVYDRMYPGEDTVYAYWSRAAATKLMAEYDRYDYFRRYLYHKADGRHSVKEVLKSMELLPFFKELEAYGGKQDMLDMEKAEKLKEYLLENFDRVLDCYREQGEAARQYFSEKLSGAAYAAAVDIGWAGSGAVSLSYLVERVWELPCRVTGILAGTNTIHNAEPDAGEIFLQQGKLVSYLFSQAHNRDVMKRHDLNKDYNIYWELLLSSPTRQFLGFGLESQAYEKQSGGGSESLTQGDAWGTGISHIRLRFGKADANQAGIREIQRGILDFTEEYLTHFGDCPWMLDISGRDACAPMLLASSHNEKYLKAVAGKFRLEAEVV